MQAKMLHTRKKRGLKKGVLHMHNVKQVPAGWYQT